MGELVIYVGWLMGAYPTQHEINGVWRQLWSGVNVLLYKVMPMIFICLLSPRLNNDMYVFPEKYGSTFHYETSDEDLLKRTICIVSLLWSNLYTLFVQHINTQLLIYCPHKSKETYQKQVNR